MAPTNTNGGNGHNKKKRKVNHAKRAKAWEAKMVDLIADGLDGGIPIPFMLTVLSKAKTGLSMTHTFTTVVKMVDAKKN